MLGNTFAGAQGEKAKAQLQKWQHMSASNLTNPKTGQDWGDEGWELVGLVSNGRGGRGELFFNRPKQ